MLLSRVRMGALQTYGSRLRQAARAVSKSWWDTNERKYARQCGPIVSKGICNIRHAPPTKYIQDAVPERGERLRCLPHAHLARILRQRYVPDVCTRFSILQCPRHNPSTCAGLASCQPKLVIPYVTASLTSPVFSMIRWHVRLSTCPTPGQST